MLDFLGEVLTTYLVINPFKQKFFIVEKECTRLKNINKTVQYITPTLHIFIKCGKVCRLGLFSRLKVHLCPTHTGTHAYK